MPQNPSTKTMNDVVDWITMQFGDSAGVQIDETKIMRWTNMAITEIISKQPDVYKGKAYADGSAGRQTYTFPSNAIQLFSVFYGDRIMSPLNFELVVDTVGENVDEQGEPKWWTQWANEFQLWPIPNVARKITLFYSARPAEIAALADPIVLGERYFPRICDYVMSKAQELDEDYSAASQSRQIFEDKLQEITNTSDVVEGTYAIRTDPDWDSWGAYQW